MPGLSSGRIRLSGCSASAIFGFLLMILPKYKEYEI